MLGFLFKTKKSRTLEEQVIIIQQGDKDLLNKIIAAYKPFIAKNVSSVCKRYIHETDDEFSIGLIAFNEAIEKYLPERGKSLLSFAEVLIKRRVIDYIRKQTKNRDISFDMNNGNEEDESPGMMIVNELSFHEYKKKTEEQLRKEEIIRFQELLHSFDLNLHDLVENSPKHKDARNNAILTAKLIAEQPELREQLYEKKRLPIKQLEEQAMVSRKTIERNRKYIIAIVLILTGDFIYMKDYLKGVL